MKDFKSYSQNAPDPDGSAANRGGSANDGARGTDGGAECGNAEINSAVETAKILSRAMNGKSEGQILNAIIAEAERGKREGSLTDADLDNFYNVLYPLLDGFKRKKLKEVITKLKSI